MTTGLKNRDQLLQTKQRPQKAALKSQTFASLGVPTRLVNSLEHEGKHFAFPIQRDTLPDTLAGRDVLGRGRTGSGKTLAFSLPLVAQLGQAGKKNSNAYSHPRALVLVPTRELATQVYKVIDPLAQQYGLKTATIFGGVSQKTQIAKLKSGLDIIVACPGRLEDFLSQKVLSLEEIQITVLDEADHMADLGFLPAVTRILRLTPKTGQRLLFSATLDKGVDRLVKQFLNNEIIHSVDEVAATSHTVTHHVLEVSDAENKSAVIRTLASGKGRRILFTRTKHQARKMARTLTQKGIPAVDLHGNLAQNARERNLALFSSGKVQVLVATDIAARGVHVDDIELVVHVDPPAEFKAFLHRSGRTARAGNVGTVVTVTLPSQKQELAMILRRASISVKPVAVNSTSPALTALIGEPAPYVKPVPTQSMNSSKKVHSKNRAPKTRYRR